ncbi:alpha/beta hydrolase [Butyrivibrio sp. AE2032]|uniref:alpha/beta hydrolase n=1 Tax=Butyrivibrio sp. AE2032 TaxID=1458463 RepID=UPI000551FF06|nr:alpha/beta hydrolase family protein [Butyrivibrio sp. AE2032]
MSILNYNFESQYLSGGTQISVILPDKTRDKTPSEFYGSGKKYPVLWLLHGTFGDNTDWVRRTNIELYASRKNLIVVMPSALNSNYSNWPKMMMGYNMYDYLVKELMPLIYGWFPASSDPKDNFIAGLSMGGRGTIKFAVNFPELFNAAAVLSAAPVDFSELKDHDDENPFMSLDDERMQTTIANAGGLEAYVNGEENVWRIIDESVKSGKKLPRLMFGCGEADSLLYGSYIKFRKHCDEIGLKADWFHLPGYKHEWAFWDLAIQHALDFFELPDDGGNPF